MDFNACNFKKINQIKAEARRWKPGDKDEPKAPERGPKNQPAKKKRKRK